MQRTILTLALAGISVLGYAGQDKTFEVGELDGLPSPTFSGSTIGITPLPSTQFINGYPWDFNDILNPADGTPGVQSYAASWEWNTDSPATSFVRITDAAGGRVVISEPGSAGGMGIYIKYDGAAGDMEMTLSIREEPTNTNDNETYETFAPWAVVSGSPDWQYFYFSYTADIISSEDNWGQAIGLGDGVYDGGGVGDAPQLEAVHFRPIPGVTATATNFQVLIDDIHSGAQHTPLGGGGGGTNVSFDSAFVEVVVDQADLLAESGEASADMRALGIDSNGNLLVFDIVGAGDNAGALYRVDVSGSSPVFTEIADEATIGAASSSTGLNPNAIVELSDGTIILGQFNAGADAIVSIDPTGPTVTQLLSRDGLNGAPALVVSGEASIIYGSEAAFGGADEIGIIPVTGGADTTFIAEADILTASGATDYSVNGFALDANTSTLYYIESDSFGGTGSLMSATGGSPALPTVVNVPGDFPGGDAGLSVVAIDSSANLFFYDEFGSAPEGQRFIVREADGTFHVPVTQAEIISSLGIPDFEAKGMAVYEVSPDELHLYVADDEDDGPRIIRITFLSTTAVDSYSLYR